MSIFLGNVSSAISMPTFPAQTYKNVGGGSPLADSTKLYYRYLRSDGTGLAGVLLVLLIYFCNFGFALFALYVFFIR